jgi:hypothetical protein
MPAGIHRRVAVGLLACNKVAGWLDSQIAEEYAIVVIST